MRVALSQAKPSYVISIYISEKKNTFAHRLVMHLEETDTLVYACMRMIKSKRSIILLIVLAKSELKHKSITCDNIQ